MSINSQQLQERLEKKLGAIVQVEDQSHLHSGHEGAKSGGKHFQIHISCPQFKGLSKLACHRLVYDAVADWMAREIHALAIQIVQPD